jgi:hypothetical protein
MVRNYLASGTVFDALSLVPAGLSIYPAPLDRKTIEMFAAKGKKT